MIPSHGQHHKSTTQPQTSVGNRPAEFNSCNSRSSLFLLLLATCDAELPPFAAMSRRSALLGNQQRESVLDSRCFKTQRHFLPPFSSPTLFLPRTAPHQTRPNSRLQRKLCYLHTWMDFHPSIQACKAVLYKTALFARFDFACMKDGSKNNAHVCVCVCVCLCWIVEFIPSCA